MDNIQEGNVIYKYDSDHCIFSFVAEKYSGPAGRDVELEIPTTISDSGREWDIKVLTSKFLHGLSVGKLIVNGPLRSATYSKYDGTMHVQGMFRGCPNLTEVIYKENVGFSTYYEDRLFTGCPALEKVVFEKGLELDKVTLRVGHPVIFEFYGAVTGKTVPTGGRGIFKYLGENQTIEGIGAGHTVVGPGVTGIHEIKQTALLEDESDATDTMLPYALPIRIDFMLPTPPALGKAQAGSINRAELHVPQGAVETYAKHPQWGKAAYITDDAGTVVDNYAATFKKVLKQREKAIAKQVVKAKNEKVAELNTIALKTLAQTALAPWRHTLEEDTDYNHKVTGIEATLTLANDTKLIVKVPIGSAITVWDDVTKEIKKLESIMSTGR